MNPVKIVLLFFMVFLVASCVQEKTEIKPAAEKALPESSIEITKIEEEKLIPSLKIIFPADNSLIKNSTVVVKLAEGNFKVVAVGSPVKENEGHFHIWLDSDKKVTAERTVTFENVISGRHSIAAELVLSNHSSLSPRVIHSISINVESDYIPETEQKQSGIREFTVEATDNYFQPNKLIARIGDRVIIHFKFRDDSIYFNGLDVKGPFEDIRYKLKGEQPITKEFTMKDETKIVSYWPASGVRKADLIVEVEI